MLKNIKKVAVKVIVLSVVAVTALSLSSCGFLNFVLKGKDMIGYNTETETTTSIIENSFNNGETIGNREEITIPKNEPNNSEGDGLTSAGQAYNSVSEVYYAVSGSVVEIITETVKNNGWMGQYVAEGAGSGVIIDGSGLIVTNHHVIDGANNVTVRLTDGSEFSSILVGTYAAADIAVIKIEPGDKKLSVATLGCSADLVVGEDVIAIGNPLGSLGGTLTTGIISATERNIIVNGEKMVLLQTNAAINPGNSGGGLFNMAGELIGIVNAKASGEDVEGLGFAIPIDYAHTIIEDLINFGYVRGIADHGLTLLDVTYNNANYIAYTYGIKITSTGVVVIESAISNEIKPGDVITKINGNDIASASAVDLAVKSHSVGDVITVTVKRDGKAMDIRLTLAEKVPDNVTFE